MGGKFELVFLAGTGLFNSRINLGLQLSNRFIFVNTGPNMMGNIPPCEVANPF